MNGVDNVDGLRRLSLMQRCHEAIDTLAMDAHAAATEHLAALDRCRLELGEIDDACKTAIGDSAGSTYDAVVRVLDKLADAQASIARLEQERDAAVTAEALLRSSHRVTVADRDKATAALEMLWAEGNALRAEIAQLKEQK